MEHRNVKGRIFNIQKYSVHDGPGVRSIIFLKGCRLRCRWCCNPESQEYEIQNMEQNGKTTVVGKDVTAGEVMDNIVRDMAYFRRSNGGITLSGGECMCQIEFAKALLNIAKEYGLSTAVETTSFAPYEDIEEVLPLIDHYLMDIKHMDSDKHRAYTGQANDLILANAKKIAESQKTNLVIRVPVIPGFNDTAEEISAIAEFASTLAGVTELHLLPYHRMGQDKYKGLNRKYLMGDAYPPTDTKMQDLKRTATAYGLKVQIGG